MRKAILGILLATSAMAEPRVKVEVLDFGQHFPSWYVEDQIKAGLKELAKLTDTKFVYRGIRELPNPLPQVQFLGVDYYKAHVRGEEASTYKSLFRPKRRKTIVIGLYPSRYTNFGYTDICARRPFIGVSYTTNTPHDFLKFAVAHEIGHVLGAYHFPAPPYTIMHPYWDSFLQPDWATGKRKWRYSRSSQKEVKQCQKKL